MPKRRKTLPTDEPYGPDKGLRRLGSAVVLRVTKDLRAREPEKALDACLAFLDGGVEAWAELLDLSIDGVEFLASGRARRLHGRSMPT